MEHLFILRVVIKRYDWHSVVKLESKRVDTVVYKDDVAWKSLVENAQVLNKKVWVSCPNAAIPIKASLDKRSVWVEIVDDRIGVLLLRRGKNYDLEMLVSSLEALPDKGPDVYAGKDRLWLF